MRPDQSGVLRSRGKSPLEFLWGTAMAAGGCFFIYMSWREGLAIGWILGIVVMLGGLALLLYQNRFTLDPRTRTWEERSGFGFFIRTTTGEFDEFRSIRVEEEQGKVGPYYAIWIVGDHGERLYDVVHSQPKMIEIVRHLQQVLGLPASGR